MPLKKQIDGDHYTSLKMQPLELSYLIAGGDTCFTLTAKYLLRDKCDVNGKSLRSIDLNKAIHSIELGASQIAKPLCEQQYKKVNNDVAFDHISAYAEQSPTETMLSVKAALLLMWNGTYDAAIAHVKIIAEIEGIELI